MSVTLTETPEPMSLRMATQPAGVAGTLMKTFGRPRRRWSRWASAIVPSMSKARLGRTSREIQPSSAFAACWRGEEVGPRGDVAARQVVVDVEGVLPLVGEVRDPALVVAVALADRLGEDRRVRRDAVDGARLDPSRELSRGDHPGRDAVEPDGLATLPVVDGAVHADPPGGWDGRTVPDFA